MNKSKFKSFLKIKALHSLLLYVLFLKVNHNYFRINKMNNDKINNKKVKYS